MVYGNYSVNSALYKPEKAVQAEGRSKKCTEIHRRATAVIYLSRRNMQ